MSDTAPSAGDKTIKSLVDSTLLVSLADFFVDILADFEASRGVLFEIALVGLLDLLDIDLLITSGLIKELSSFSSSATSGRAFSFSTSP